jgi:hypothetical protein
VSLDAVFTYMTEDNVIFTVHYPASWVYEIDPQGTYFATDTAALEIVYNGLTPASDGAVVYVLAFPPDPTVTGTPIEFLEGLLVGIEGYGEVEATEVNGAEGARAYFDNPDAGEGVLYFFRDASTDNVILAVGVTGDFETFAPTIEAMIHSVVFGDETGAAPRPSTELESLTQALTLVEGIESVTLQTPENWVAIENQLIAASTEAAVARLNNDESLINGDAVVRVIPQIGTVASVRSSEEILENIIAGSDEELSFEAITEIVTVTGQAIAKVRLQSPLWEGAIYAYELDEESALVIIVIAADFAAFEATADALVSTITYVDTRLE